MVRLIIDAAQFHHRRLLGHQPHDQFSGQRIVEFRIDDSVHWLLPQKTKLAAVAVFAMCDSSVACDRKDDSVTTYPVIQIIVGINMAFLDEHQRLLVEESAVLLAEEELQSLCVTAAPVFVAVQHRHELVQGSLEALSRLDTAACVDDATRALDQEQSSLAQLSENHRVRRRTLLQHSSLLELLELPSLMDACVRATQYEEALTICTLANTLEKRHSGAAGGVVPAVTAQIRARSLDLRRHLLYRLKQNVQNMPACLEVVTALRRLNALDLERSNSQTTDTHERRHFGLELQLRIDFLEARNVWLDTTTTQNQSELLLDLIERHRTRIFEIATQYNAIFQGTTASSTNNLEDISQQLLSMWMSRRIQTFINILTTQLFHNSKNATVVVPDAGALRDVIDAVLFFTSSCQRFGADFLPLLAPILESKLVALVKQQHWIDGGLQPLQETLRICREAGVATPLLNLNETSLFVAAALDAEPLPPPRLLLGYPPLARLVNAVLAGLNELRRCLLPGVVCTLRTALRLQVLRPALQELQQNERLVLTPGFAASQIKGLREAAPKLIQVFQLIVEPYLLGSLESALGNPEQTIHFYTIYRQNEQQLLNPVTATVESVTSADEPAEEKEESSPPLEPDPLETNEETKENQPDAE
jgi:conserved oligomeric Golgi complex subunit 8